MAIKGKKILITAGPTWSAIDKVRIITNIFSGRTGCAIAKRARELGVKVTLLLGPGQMDLPKNYFKGINVLRFRYFDELLKLMQKEISTKKYAAVIHSAAVSDYLPVKKAAGKIPSGKSALTIRLRPAAKIIRRIKNWDPNIFLVQFKLEAGKSPKKLIAASYKSMLKNRADLAVANDLSNLNRAYIIDREKGVTKVSNRLQLADVILKESEISHEKT